jgi:hypothetical protein
VPKRRSTPRQTPTLPPERNTTIPAAPQSTMASAEGKKAHPLDAAQVSDIVRADRANSAVAGFSLCPPRPPSLPILVPSQVRKAAGALISHLRKTAPAGALVDEDLTISMSIHLTRIPGRFVPKAIRM